MGKVKVRALGDETLENEQKQKSRLASEVKRAKQKNKEKKLVKGGKGGERVVAVGPSEEELQAVIVNEAKQSQIKKTAASQILNSDKKIKQKKTKERTRSKNYLAIVKTLDRSKKYSLTDALSVLEKLKRSKFDETVELHLNTTELGVSGNITLPHGTGKQIRVAIADPSANSASHSTVSSDRIGSLQTGSGQIDDLLKKIEQGIIEFDVLLATPDAMPKLARVAKILGPRGLMPNPKNNTITNDPKRLALSFAKGQVYFKTEAKAPIMHLTVGKMSFGTKKLAENIQALIETIKKEKIRNITLKSTMSPGIKLDLSL